MKTQYKVSFIVRVSSKNQLTPAHDKRIRKLLKEEYSHNWEEFCICAEEKPERHPMVRVINKSIEIEEIGP